jgi:hypothetical protein
MKFDVTSACAVTIIVAATALALLILTTGAAGRAAMNPAGTSQTVTSGYDVTSLAFRFDEDHANRVATIEFDLDSRANAATARVGPHALPCSLDGAGTHATCSTGNASIDISNIDDVSVDAHV